MRLVISPFVPTRNSTQAGHRLLYEYLLKCGELGPTHLFILANSTESELLPTVDIKGVTLVGSVVFSKLGRLLAILRNLRDLAPRFSTRYHASALSNILELCRTHEYSDIRFEFSQTFAYHKAVAEALPRAKTELGIIDVQIQVILRKGGVEGTLFSWFTHQTERSMLSQGATAVTLCDKDTNLIRSLYGERINCRRTAVPLPPWVYEVRRHRDTIESHSLLFWGAMDRAENQQAALWFIDHVFTPAAKQVGRGTLYIVGARPSRKLLSRAAKNIIVTGFVEDPVPYFSRASCGVVPLLSGAGIKLKTLEMLAAGLPVISTDIGAEGIDQTGNSLQVIPAENFLQRVIKFLQAD